MRVIYFLFSTSTRLSSYQKNWVLYIMQSLTASPPSITTSAVNQLPQSQSPIRSFRDSPRAKARLACASSSSDYSGSYQVIASGQLVQAQPSASPPVAKEESPDVGAGGDGEAPEDPLELDLQDSEVVSNPKLETNVHLLLCQADPLYKCEICNKEATSKFNLARHVKTHAKEDAGIQASPMLKCSDECSFSYSADRTWELRRHRKRKNACTM